MASENKKIIVSVEVRESGSKSVGDSAGKAAKDLTKLTQAERAARIEAEKLKITNAAVTASLKQEAAAALQASAATGQMKATSGLNNAILLETSRLASDASYGFQGISNNLGQLISLLQISSQNAGGFVATLKNLGKSLLGTGGILIAVQLLISFLPQVERYFRGAAKAAEEFDKKLKDLTKSLYEQINLYGRLTSALFEYNVSGKAVDDTVSLLSNRFSEFRAGIEKLTKSGFGKNEESVLNLMKSFERLLIVRKSLIEVDEQYKKRVEESGAEDVKAIRLRGEYKDLLRELIELEKLFTLEKETGTKKDQKRYKRDFLRFTDEIFQARKALRDALTSDEEAQMRDLAFLEKQKLREERDAFIEAQAQRLKDGLITDKQFKETKIQAAEELQTALVAIDRKTEVLISTFRLDQQQKANEQQTLNYKDRIKLELENSLLTEQIEGKRAGARLKLEQIALSSRIEANKLLLDSDTLNAVDRAKLQSQITQDEIKQSAIRMKIADAEANARVQSFELIANGLTALSNAVGRETEVGRGLAVTSTLISTYSAAQKAYESQFLPIPTSSSPVRAELARAVAIIQGLASVKSILSANKSGASSVPKSNVQVEAPDFNVVGASPESQLAQSVSAQQMKPIKAFVVGKEITNRQEFDRNIITTSALGN